MGGHKHISNYFRPRLSVINLRPAACPEYIHCPRAFKDLRLLMGKSCLSPEFKGCIIYKLFEGLR